jgi:hypothetical protein
MRTERKRHHPMVFDEACQNHSVNFCVNENCYLARLPIDKTHFQFVIGTTMPGSSRRSKRGQPPESPEEASSSGASEKAKRLATRVSVRNVNNCCEFGTRNDLCCSSCQKCCEIPEKKRKDRSMCMSRTHLCCEPCKHDAECLKMPHDKGWLAEHSPNLVSCRQSKCGDLCTTWGRCDAIKQNKC